MSKPRNRRSLAGEGDIFRDAEFDSEIFIKMMAEEDELRSHPRRPAWRRIDDWHEWRWTRKQLDDWEDWEVE